MSALLRIRRTVRQARTGQQAGRPLLHFIFDESCQAHRRNPVMMRPTTHEAPARGDIVRMVKEAFSFPIGATDTYDFIES